MLAQASHRLIACMCNMNVHLKENVTGKLSIDLWVGMIHGEKRMRKKRHRVSRRKGVLNVTAMHAIEWIDRWINKA